MGLLILTDSARVRLEPSLTPSDLPFPAPTRQLFSLLDDAELGPMAADGFSLMMNDSADVLNRSCHADVRIMYRQRFFSENAAKLVQGFDAAPQGTNGKITTPICHMPVRVRVQFLRKLCRQRIW